MQLKEISAREHDEFMQAHPKEHFMQCSLWGKVKATSGWTYTTVGLFDKETLKASSLLLFRKIPVLNCRICYAPRGYVIDFSDWNLVETFSTELKKYCQKRNVCYIMVDPDIDYQRWNAKDELIAQNLDFVAKMEALGYRHQGFNDSFDMTQPRFTFRLKLDQPKEKIFANYSKVVRASMNNAARIGIRCQKETNVDTFYEIMQDTADRANFVERNKEYYQTVYDLFSACGMAECYSAAYYAQDHLKAMEEKQAELEKEKAKCEKKLETSPQDTRSANRIKQIDIQMEKIVKDRKKAEDFLQSYPDGLALSSGITISTAHRAWLVYGGNRRILREAGANYAIKQFEINDDIDKHFEFVDFFGTIGHPSASSEHIGIHEFKKKFSGDYVEFPGEFHLVLKPLQYALWIKAAPEIKKLLRRMKKRKKTSA